MPARHVAQQRTRPWFLLAMAVTVILAIPLVRLSPGPSPREIMRGADEPAVLIAPPIEATPVQSRTFIWHPVRRARLYGLEILTRSGSPEFTTRTADTTVTL